MGEMTNFSIRPATPADLATLVAFTLAEATEAEGREKSSQTVSDGIKAALENPALARYWLLETGQGQTVGHMSVVTEWSDWHAGRYWWIQSLFIRPDYRSQGLLGLLLDRLKAIARQEQALELRLYVHRDNRRAIQAYRREGFAESDYEIMVMGLGER